MESATPLISIITPSFNQGRFIEETILSIRNQSYNNIEHIVIDGMSTDQTLEVLGRYSSSVKWISEPDTGQTNAINKGLQRSHGEILAYLNSDDLYLPETIHTVVDYFSKHPEIDMVYGDIIHIDEDSKEIEEIKTGLIDIEKYLTGRVYLPQPTVFFRKKVFDKIGLFDEHLHLAMDFDYWVRIFLHCRTAYLPVLLAKARIYPNAKSIVNSQKYLDERIYILDKTFSEENADVLHFGSPQETERIKNRAYGYVYFHGGIGLQDRKQFPLAISYILRGIRLYPKKIFSSSILWYFFIIIFGKKIAKKIEPHLPKPNRRVT